MSTCASSPAGQCTHKVYKLTCDDFAQLQERANGACERCRVLFTRLHIDHDHSLGWYAVRGLVCPKCNAYLGEVDRGRKEVDPATESYLATAWHVGKPPTRSSRTPIFTFRMPDNLWNATKSAAERNHETVTDVITRALSAYVRRNKP